MLCTIEVDREYCLYTTIEIFLRIGRDRYLLKVFYDDISDYLKELMDSRFEIVLSLDGNKNMRYGRIVKAFLNLHLSETLQVFSDKVAPTTFYIERNQLDAV